MAKLGRRLEPTTLSSISVWGRGSFKPEKGAGPGNVNLWLMFQSISLIHRGDMVPLTIMSPARVVDYSCQPGFRVPERGL